MIIENKQLAVVRAIRVACKGLAEVVSEYPFGCDIVGDQTAILVQSGDEAWTPIQGKLDIIEQRVRVHLYTYQAAGAMKTMLGLQGAVMGAVLDDISLGGAADCIRVEGVTTGDWVGNDVLHTEGYNENYQHRTIEFLATMRVGGTYG